MPELKCSVHTCAHNKDVYCDLDKIQVAGSAAQYADETSCANFTERKGAYSNSGKEASSKSQVDCQAQDCKYNEGCSCHAGKINVGGECACDSCETECATFEKELE